MDGMRMHAPRAGATWLDGGAELFDQLELGDDIPDLWDVLELDRGIAEQTRGDQRERRILVACGNKRAVEPTAAFDDESIHPYHHTSPSRLAVSSRV
jgi:hypothetical protein